MADFKTDNDALWTAVASQLVGLVKTRLSIPKGRAYFSIASGAHKKLIEYWAWFGSRDGKAQVDIETFGGEEAKAAIEALIAKAPAGHIIKTAEAKQGVKNKDKWFWPITIQYADMSDEQLAKWYVNTITALYTFFEGVEGAPAVDMSEKAKLAEEQAEAQAAKAELEALKKAQAEAEAARAELEALKKAQAEAEAARAEVERLKAEAEAARAAAEKAKVEAEKAAAETAKAATPAATRASKKDGELPGRFTINSKGDKICFSRGLLQFNPAKYEFRFAENQYDIIGNDNEKIAPNYDGWIDLFGWGTSGFMGCQPTEVSKNNSDYGPASGDIAGTNYDWGVYNPITNGGNKEGLWRTPTADEWSYLVNNRPNASKLRVKCSVCGREGYLILPDDFWNNRLRMPLDITAADYSVNKYTAEQWSQLEALGVVFMPKVGWREAKTYGNGSVCVWLASAYSSSSSSSSSSAHYGYFEYSSDTNKYKGFSVRLIKDVK